MRLEGDFQWFQSKRKGGRWSIRFQLRCTRWWRKEAFSYAIFDGTGQLEPYRSFLELPANNAVNIDYDTCSWDWCQGDTFAVLNEKDEIVEHWTLSLHTYAPGECPECHGTKQCQKCQGTGQIKSQNHMISTCPDCLGTGTCVCCYVPIRKIIGNTTGTTLTNDNTLASANHPAMDMSRQRKIDSLHKQIFDLQTKIQQCEWDERMMQMRNLDVSAHGVYMAKLQLKMKYHQQLINLQHELQQLEGM